MRNKLVCICIGLPVLHIMKTVPVIVSVCPDGLVRTGSLMVMGFSGLTVTIVVLIGDFYGWTGVGFNLGKLAYCA